MSGPEISLYEKSILGCGLWSGLDCGIKGSGPIMSNFWGQFFHFFGVNIFFFNFLPMKNWKNDPKRLLRIGPDPFFPQSSPVSAHSQKLIFHIVKFRDQTSVLLSVFLTLVCFCNFNEWAKPKNCHPKPLFEVIAIQYFSLILISRPLWQPMHFQRWRITSSTLNKVCHKAVPFFSKYNSFVKRRPRIKGNLLDQVKRVDSNLPACPVA